MNINNRGVDRRSFLASASMGVVMIGVEPSRRQAPPPKPPDPADHPLYMPGADIKWQRIAPEAGEWSPEMAILHVAPGTNATQLMIRVPKGQHVPPHWHTANETHTILSGTFLMECDGQKVELGPGSFNYMPLAWFTRRGRSRTKARCSSSRWTARGTSTSSRRRNSVNQASERKGLTDYQRLSFKYEL